MLSQEAKQAARLVQLEGAILGLLRDAEEDGLDGLTITAEANAGQVSIDLAYTSNGMPMHGESL